MVKTVKSRASLDCDNENTHVKDDSMLKAVEQMLQIESSEQINKTLTNENLQSAGEMFLHLFMCPYTEKPWLLFYKELFQTQSPDQIILTLNRIMKGPRAQTNKFFKNVAEILLNRTLSTFHGRGAESTASSAEKELKREGRFIKFITKALFQPRLEFFYL